MILPVTVPASEVDSALHQIIRADAASQGDSITGEQPVERDGATGIEVKAKVSDGYDARFLALIAGSRVYLFGVHAKHGTQRLYDALVASLVMY